MGEKTIKERLNKIDKQGKKGIRRQCDLLCVSRSSLYYSPNKASD
ncbi:MAG: hypothetical protein PHC55_10945 [Bacteroidales bacterium]|jgi:hypothetical protein|nr:hypothetical protein [Bacteroidales bacterium]